MNYEKAYKEALEKLEVILNLNTVKKSGTIYVDDIQKIFPELKENEDERIKKMLRDILSQWKNEIPAWCSDIKLIDATLKWIEQQGEQKPAEELKPKYKVGDWVVSPNGVYWHIDAINDNRYEVSCTTGEGANWPLDTSLYHLWTIQDAKAGDVLAYVTDEGDLWIMIFWSLYEPYEGLVHYHALLVNDNFGDKGTCCICIDNLKPATKEQCDLLFQKMKEAGYEWDAKKKELKKIEQNCYHNDGLYYAIDILEKTFGKVEGYQSNDGKIEHQKAIETINALYHKKPAEWSEEDETMLKTIISDFSRGCGSSIGQEQWLKSLSPQSHWKPSEEQMNALSTAKNSHFDLSYKTKDILESLYNDLKKL